MFSFAHVAKFRQFYTAACAVISSGSGYKIGAIALFIPILYITSTSPLLWNKRAHQNKDVKKTLCYMKQLQSCYRQRLYEFLYTIID